MRLSEITHMGSWSNAFAALAAVFACLSAGPARAQVRGVYPLGMSAVGGGLLPETGVTYANLFLFYARDRLGHFREPT